MRKLHNFWFYLAEEDIRMAELALDERMYTQACFNSQSAVSKIFKCFLQINKGFIPKTRSLDELLRYCYEIKIDFKSLQDKCIILDDYRLPARHPDLVPAILSKSAGFPNEKDALEALNFANEIKNFVNDIIVKDNLSNQEDK